MVIFKIVYSIMIIGSCTTWVCTRSQKLGAFGSGDLRTTIRTASEALRLVPRQGSRVAKGLGLDLKEVESLAQMSQEERVKATQ